MSQIQKSTAADAKKIAHIIRRSVIELCAADHNNQADILEPWLANKTEQCVAQWVSAKDSYCVSALDAANELVGFGMMSLQGEIKLLYVSPDQIGTGAGRDLLLAMESKALSLGVQKVILDSTDTAMKFYQHHGYTRTGACGPRDGGLSCNSMFKKLAAADAHLT